MAGNDPLMKNGAHRELKSACCWYIWLHIVSTRSHLRARRSRPKTDAFGTVFSLVLGLRRCTMVAQLAFSLGLPLSARPSNLTRSRDKSVPPGSLIGTVYVRRRAAAILRSAKVQGGKRRVATLH